MGFRFSFALVMFFWASLLQAAPFKISDIRLDGLQRVSAGSVFSAFPISVGETPTAKELVSATRVLFKTGYFKDVQIGQDGDVLVLTLVELPTINSIEIDGNKAIETDMLKEGLKQAGLSEGLVFKRSTLDRIGLELERQYVAQGRYDAKIETELEELPRNRVGLVIKVNEGTVASIKHINIVGNKAYDNETLLKSFELDASNMWSWYKSDDKYSREKLSGDLERLRSYYLDRGYVRFNIESTQVSVSPDKEDVYITVNVDEGDIYNINEVKMAGDLAVPENEMSLLLVVKPEQRFSRQNINFTQELMTKRLGNEGYTFAKVNGIPKINDEDKTVDVTFYVVPGKRTYVRSINFTGNVTTKDEVLRREMHQMDGGAASTELIELSKSRLERLGYFKEVSVKTPSVPGTDDMIDVNYTVEEQLNGSLNFNLGFSQSSGFIIGTSISQTNFLGTGNRMSLSVNKTDTVQSYSASYLNPYYTIDGVSRGFNAFFRETDYSGQSFSDYRTDTYGGTMTFGYPVDNYQRISLDVGVDHLKLVPGNTDSTPKEIFNFVAENGDEFDELTLGAKWKWSSLNRGLMPTRGVSQSLNLSASVPGSELEYYKLTYTGQYFKPVYKDWILRFRTELGYGDGYGTTSSLPIFRNFRAGGIGSVRGYTASSLGPKGLPSGSGEKALSKIGSDGGVEVIDASTTETSVAYIEVDGKVVAVTVPVGKTAVALTDTDDNAITGLYIPVDPRALGGNILMEFSTELIFPLPFIEDRRSVRSYFYYDMGNVFTDQCLEGNPACDNGIDLNEIRTAVGVGLTWITGIGPLTFTYSKPLNDKEGDDTEGFEFSLGQTF